MNVKSLTALMAKAGTEFATPAGELVFPNKVGVPFWPVAPANLLAAVDVDKTKAYFASMYGGDAVAKAITGLSNSANVTRCWYRRDKRLVIGRNRAPQGISGLVTRLKTLKPYTGADFGQKLGALLQKLGFFGVNGRGYTFDMVRGSLWPFPGLLVVSSVTSSNYTTIPVDIIGLTSVLPTDLQCMANSSVIYNLWYKIPTGYDGLMGINMTSDGSMCSLVYRDQDKAVKTIQVWGTTTTQSPLQNRLKGNDYSQSSSPKWANSAAGTSGTFEPTSGAVDEGNLALRNAIGFSPPTGRTTDWAGSMAIFDAAANTNATGLFTCANTSADQYSDFVDRFFVISGFDPVYAQSMWTYADADEIANDPPVSGSGVEDFIVLKSCERMSILSSDFGARYSLAMTNVGKSPDSALVAEFNKSRSFEYASFGHEYSPLLSNTSMARMASVMDEPVWSMTISDTLTWGDVEARVQKMRDNTGTTIPGLVLVSSDMSVTYPALTVTFTSVTPYGVSGVDSEGQTYDCEACFYAINATGMFSSVTFVYVGVTPADVQAKTGKATSADQIAVLNGVTGSVNAYLAGIIDKITEIKNYQAAFDPTTLLISRNQSIQTATDAVFMMHATSGWDLYPVMLHATAGPGGMLVKNA